MEMTIEDFKECLDESCPTIEDLFFALQTDFKVLSKEKQEQDVIISLLQADKYKKNATILNLQSKQEEQIAMIALLKSQQEERNADNAALQSQITGTLNSILKITNSLCNIF